MSKQNPVVSSTTRPPVAMPTHAFVIPDELRRGLDSLAEDEGATSFMALLAAFAALLWRYTGEEDIRVGIPLANRSQPDGQHRSGAVSNTVVIRADVSGEPCYRDLIRRVRAAVTSALAHAEAPLASVSRAIHSDACRGQAADLSQVMFVFQHVEIGVERGNGFRGSAEPVPRGSTASDLTLRIEERAHGLRGLLVYNGNRFDSLTIARLSGHFLTLLNGMLAEPDRAVDRAPFLSAGERHRALVEWNQTAADFPLATCLPQLVEAQVARTPDRSAVRFEGRSLSYAELNNRANRLAHYLRAFGVGPDTRVGVCLERSSELVVALLGILKAGGAYVPLDPTFPPERLALYVEDSCMAVAVTCGDLRASLPRNVPVVLVDADRAVIESQPADNLAPAMKPEHLVYVTYTSGSTGRPKGVMTIHRGLVNFLFALARRIDFTGDDILLAVTTLSFDMHAPEIWMPLILGAPVVMASRAATCDGTQLVELLDRHDVTFMQATPATWRLLLAAGWEGSPRLKSISGGEALSTELAEQLVSRTGAFWNGYGPTESTCCVTLHRVHAVGRSIPIGRPIDNTQVYVLDRHLEPVPVGVRGEIYVGGVGVTRGYLDRASLTVERFVPSPFRPGECLYRTGDLARYLSDGTIDYLGRADDQVKIRGFRIELGEVEAALARHADVRQAIVVARREDSGSGLAAYVILRPGASADPGAWQQHLRAVLPEYMVPSRYAILDAPPLTPNGKVDRQALAEHGPIPFSVAARHPAVRPRNDAERDLLAVWREVLQAPEMGVTDDFLDLGGHSFQAALLLSRIKQRLGHSLPLGLLHETGTVERMAAHLQQQLEIQSGRCLVPFNEGGERPPLFLIAGIGGHVFTFHKFARMLGPDQPAYGVRAIGVDGAEVPPNRFEAIAARYLDEILAVRPDGPYVLGGYSIGATIAYELALQLRARGKEVGLLAVFDRQAPGYPVPLSWSRRLCVHAGMMVRAPWRDKWRYLRERIRNGCERLLLRAGLGLVAAPDVAELEMFSRATLKRVWVSLREAQQYYRPTQRFDGHILLFKASEPPPWTPHVEEDPLMGWQEWNTGQVELHTIAGAHLEMFSEENLPRLAAPLREAIGRLTRRNGDPGRERYAKPSSGKRLRCE